MGEMPVLRGDYASRLPELGIPWEAVRLDAPALVVLNEQLASDLGLDPDWLRGPEGIRMLVGNMLPEHATPVAQGYAGHQFGFYSPRLGDGRALLLGELETPDGALRDVHLKGSGPTPYSRGADGFAAIGPMLREHLLSEAMHALGVPTTRSLAVVATGRAVSRDADLLPGAVLTRIADSHLRVGTFQYARATGDIDLLRRLADFAIARHHPEAAASAEPYAELLTAVVERQASLIASWMLVGFVHGVMNTDNTTISGETIDYGPCAFIDAYDPSAVFSSIDHAGRYAFGRQPGIGLWNVSRLADALLPLLAGTQEDAIAVAEDRVRAFAPAYERSRLAGMRAKLGVAGADDQAVAELSTGLLTVLAEQRIDFTLCFRALTDAAAGDDAPLGALFDAAGAPRDWLERWRRLRPDAAVMRAANPVFVPRNHLVDEALSAATAGDSAPFETLTAVLANPFDEQPGRERFAQPPPAGAAPAVTFCGT